MPGLIVAIVLVAVIVVIKMIASRSGDRDLDGFLTLLRSGGRQAARAWVDQKYPAATALTRGNAAKIRQRMAVLALAGDIATVERELAAQSGDLPWLAMAQSAGLLAMAVHGPDARDAAARMAALRQRTETELKGVMKGAHLPGVRAIAQVTDALGGFAPPPPNTLALKKTVAFQPFLWCIAWQGVAKALELHGDPRARDYRAEVEKVMKTSV